MLAGLGLGVTAEPAPSPVAANMDLADTLPLTNAQEAIFENEGPRFLLDAATSRRIFRENAKLEAVVPSAEKHGEGSFGYTTSAELHLRGAQDRKFTTLAAFKVAKIDPHDIIEDGIAHDVVRELGTYAKTQAADSVGKCVFAKLTKGEFRFAMEHYLMDLHRLVDNSAAMSPADWMPVARCLMFQVAHGLKELHAAGVLHKDLKPENVLMAHTGRAIIIDFGLSTYLADGLSSQPQSTYFRDTTATIQPPEAAIDSRSDEPLSSAYDIWSLGCCFDYFVTGKYSFNFWATLRSPSSPGRRATDWKDVVTERDYEDKIADVIAECGAQGLPAEGVDLLGRMLTMSQKDRLTAAEVVAHPFFKGLTVADAAREIQERLGLGSVTGEKAKNILTRAVKRGDPGAAENAELASYFQIRPHPMPKPDRLFERPLRPRPAGAPVLPPGPLSRDAVRVAWNHYFGFVLDGKFKLPLYSYLHCLELNERIVKETGKFPETPERAIIAASPICTLADKACPLESTHSILKSYKLLKDVSTTKDYILGGELAILRMLNGDIYPLKDGFVERALRLIGDGAPGATVALARFLFTVLTFWYSPGGTKLDDLFAVARYFSRKYEDADVAELRGSAADLRRAVIAGYGTAVTTEESKYMDFCLFHSHVGAYSVYGLNPDKVRQILEIPAEKDIPLPAGMLRMHQTLKLQTLITSLLDFPTIRRALP